VYEVAKASNDVRSLWRSDLDMRFRESILVDAKLLKADNTSGKTVSLLARNLSFASNHTPNSDSVQVTEIGYSHTAISEMRENWRPRRCGDDN
jgi:hypothetical protein